MDAWLGSESTFGWEHVRRTRRNPAKAYKLLGATDDGYATDGRFVYFEQGTPDGLHIFVVDGADVATFVSTGYRTGKDKDHAFEDDRIAAP